MAGTQTTQFFYDPDGNLVKKINPDGSKTIYVGGIYEEDKNPSGAVTQTRTYYPAGGAVRVDGTLYYVLKDHLGSASVVMDATGTIVVGEDRFYPFGETRFTTGILQTDKLFTGQREMARLGICDYGARFYSRKLASSFRGLQPLHFHHRLHGMKFRIPGDDCGILLYGSRDCKAIGIGNGMIRLDMRGGKYDLLIYRHSLDGQLPNECQCILGFYNPASSFCDI
jgi:YD repeat-containing protein